MRVFKCVFTWLYLFLDLLTIVHKDSATNRKTALAAEYRHMRDMLSRDEHEAVNSVDRELEGGQTKLKGLAKKFSENLVSMSKAKEEIHSLLSQCHTQSFLQVRPRALSTRTLTFKMWKVTKMPKFEWNVFGLVFFKAVVCGTYP